MDMILEQNDDNNTGLGGGTYAGNRHDMTPPASLPEIATPTNGYSFGGAQLYSPKGNNKYREPLMANKYDNKSYIESDED
jgi:hypothetical protein